MADVLMCPVCRHPTRKHGADGCDAGCWCDETPESITGSAAAPEPAPPAPAAAAPVDEPEPAVDGEDLDDDDQDDEPVDELDGIGSECIADPVERIQVLAELAPEYVRPVEPEPPAQPPRSPFADALMWWDAWHCTFCFSRYFAARVCCDRPAVPVQVMVLPREVGRR